MLFQPDLAEQILLGRKTVTRRVVKPGDLPFYDDGTGGEIVEVHNIGPRRGYERTMQLRYSVGSDYAVQAGRGKKAIARIRLTKISLEHLQEIVRQPAAVLDEGLPYANVGLFEELWDRINPGAPWSSNPEVWVLRFHLIRRAG